MMKGESKGKKHTQILKCSHKHKISDFNHKTLIILHKVSEISLTAKLYGPK